MIDMPSVDREEDNGELRSHNMFFFNEKKEMRENCSITEIFYAESDIKDGLYFVNFQIAAFENDASPSRPLLYSVEKV